MIWMNYANLDLELIDRKDDDIRISFEQGKGSWLLIWAESLENSIYINSSKSISGKIDSSMNFGWFNEQTPELEFHRTILH
jgi:hypothetical protein